MGSTCKSKPNDLYFWRFWRSSLAIRTSCIQSITQGMAPSQEWYIRPIWKQNNMMAYFNILVSTRYTCFANFSGVLISPIFYNKLEYDLDWIWSFRRKWRFTLPLYYKSNQLCCISQPIYHEMIWRIIYIKCFFFKSGIYWQCHITRI